MVRTVFYCAVWKLSSVCRIPSCVKGHKLRFSTQALELHSPKSFESNFVMPARTEHFHLEKDNAHPIDEKIDFNEDEHIYSFDNQPIKVSVTGLIADYFDKFIAPDAVKLMVNGKNWPRKDYLHENGEVFTEADILKKWDDIGLSARNRGTWMHYNIERYINNLPAAIDFPEMEQFQDFYVKNVIGREITPYRTEWCIAAPDLNLAGSVDFVGKMPDGTYCIIDWKRAKNLAGSFKNSFGKKGKGPLQHLDSCDANKYQIQLGVYKYILEKYYDMKVSWMAVATFHPDLKAYYAIQAKSFDNEVKNMLSDYHEKNKTLNFSMI